MFHDDDAVPDNRRQLAERKLRNGVKELKKKLRRRSAARWSPRSPLFQTPMTSRLAGLITSNDPQVAGNIAIARPSLRCIGRLELSRARICCFCGLPREGTYMTEAKNGRLQDRTARRGLRCDAWAT